jgi:hypothetical protein
MVQFKGFNVTVRMNGDDVAEFEAENDDESETNTITRYIEVKSGQAFSISCSTVQKDRIPGTRKATGVIYRALIDGNCIYDYCISAAPWKSEISKADEVRDGKRYRRSLIFSDLQIGAFHSYLHSS